MSKQWGHDLNDPLWWERLSGMLYGALANNSVSQSSFLGYNRKVTSWKALKAVILTALQQKGQHADCLKALKAVILTDLKQKGWHADCLKALKAVIMTAIQQKGWHAYWLLITQGIEGCHPSMLSMPQVMSKQSKWWPFFNSNISPGLFSTWQTIY